MITLRETVEGKGKELKQESTYDVCAGFPNEQQNPQINSEDKTILPPAFLPVRTVPASSSADDVWFLVDHKLSPRAPFL